MQLNSCGFLGRQSSFSAVSTAENDLHFQYEKKPLKPFMIEIKEVKIPKFTVQFLQFIV